MAKSASTQRRGEELRRHVLLAAKDVFVEAGYERASMDAVAERASTSKRSLYAHFASKEQLFGAVLELIGELYVGTLGRPGDYADDPTEAVVLFCARFLQLTTWQPQLRTCRLLLTEAERQPASARRYFDAVFGTAYARLDEFLETHRETAGLNARDLIGAAVLPILIETLLGVHRPIRGRSGHPPSPSSLDRDVDLQAIRQRLRAFGIDVHFST